MLASGLHKLIFPLQGWTDHGLSRQPFPWLVISVAGHFRGWLFQWLIISVAGQLGCETVDAPEVPKLVSH